MFQVTKEVAGVDQEALEATVEAEEVSPLTDTPRSIDKTVTTSTTHWRWWMLYFTMIMCNWLSSRNNQTIVNRKL